MSRCCWKNITHRLAHLRVAANLQVVKKNARSVKSNKAKGNKMRYAYIINYIFKVYNLINFDM